MHGMVESWDLSGPNI
uniref:Uncharacterized protein n=1 Tax=Arundo donax TaxID=35708 RepID=A0A0A9C016_ARUDO